MKFLIILVILAVDLACGDDVLDFTCKIFKPHGKRCNGDKQNQTKFFLYTRDQPNGFELKINDEEKLTASGYLREHPLKLMIHGYGGALKHNFPNETKNGKLTSKMYAYLNLNSVSGPNPGEDEMNIIIVDWTAASNPKLDLSLGYMSTVSCARPVATVIGNFVQFLIDKQYLTPDKLHIIGHSIGSHIAGMIGLGLNGEAARITSLDPARPCFREKDTPATNRLEMSDAKFVDVIHTDGYNGWNLGRGLMERIGHIDFYANGGKTPQPGCNNFTNAADGCSHFRVHNLFTESITNPGGYPARRCENYDKFTNGSCDSDLVTPMGATTPILSTRADSPYYFRTGSKAPFALGERGARGK